MQLKFITQPQNRYFIITCRMDGLVNR